MSVNRRNIFGPGLSSGPGGDMDDAGTPSYPAVSYGPMGETGVDDNTTARHQGIVSDHQAASARESGRAVPGDQSGAGMVIGTASPLVLGADGSDAPNQGTPSKTIAGTDGFSVASDGGDTGDQTGAGKTLL